MRLLWRPTKEICIRCAFKRGELGFFALPPQLPGSGTSEPPLFRGPAAEAEWVGSCCLAAQGSQARQRAPSPPSAPFRGPAAEAEWVGSCCHNRNRKMLHTCTSSWTGQERVNPTRCIGYRIRAYRARACLKQCPICKRATLHRYVLAVSEPTPSTHNV